MQLKLAEERPYTSMFVQRSVDTVQGVCLRESDL